MATVVRTGAPGVGPGRDAGTPVASDPAGVAVDDGRVDAASAPGPHFLLAIGRDSNGTPGKSTVTNWARLAVVSPETSAGVFREVTAGESSPRSFPAAPTFICRMDGEFSGTLPLAVPERGAAGRDCFGDGTRLTDRPAVGFFKNEAVQPPPGREEEIAVAFPPCGERGWLCSGTPVFDGPWARVGSKPVGVGRSER